MKQAHPNRACGARRLLPQMPSYVVFL